MSEKKGPFDMVIWLSHIIEIAAKRKKFTAKDNEISNVVCGILEAVGKVDKKWAVLAMDLLSYPAIAYDDLCNKDALEALLDSLPDPAQNADTDSATFMGMDKATELVREKIEAMRGKEEK